MIPRSGIAKRPRQRSPPAWSNPVPYPSTALAGGTRDSAQRNRQATAPAVAARMEQPRSLPVHGVGRRHPRFRTAESPSDRASGRRPHGATPFPTRPRRWPEAPAIPHSGIAKRPRQRSPPAWSNPVPYPSTALAGGTRDSAQRNRQATAPAVAARFGVRIGEDRNRGMGVALHHCEASAAARRRRPCGRTGVSGRTDERVALAPAPLGPHRRQ